jgi:hypothetical protein
VNGVIAIAGVPTVVQQAARSDRNSRPERDTAVRPRDELFWTLRAPLRVGY